MDQRTKLLIILLVLALLGYAGMSLLVDGGPSSSINRLAAERNFAVADINEVGKIFLADKMGNTTLLEKIDQIWMYNGRYKANPNAIENLLNTLHKIDIKFKPPDAAVQHMVANLASEGIKVMIYNKGGDLLKSYYVGGATGDELGTYLIMEGHDQPYVGHLPGWTGNIRFRYNLTGEDWRDKTIFDYPLGTIKSLSVAYPKQEQHSFRIEKSGKDYTVIKLPESKVQFTVNSGQVERYLKGFEQVGAEAFENENPKRDSIINQLPFAVFEIETQDGNVQKLQLFPIEPTFIEYDAKTGEVIPASNIIERYFAFDSSNDFYLIQHRVFKKLLLGFEYFASK